MHQKALFLGPLSVFAKLQMGMEPPDPIFRGVCGARWRASFSSWLPTLVYCPGDLPVVNESCHPYSQCARKCARCPKVENSVASEPSKSTSQCIAVCTKSQCAARSSRDLSAQPGAGQFRGVIFKSGLQNGSLSGEPAQKRAPGPRSRFPSHRVFW